MENPKRSFINRAWSWYRAAFTATPFFTSAGTMGILYIILIGVLELIDKLV